MDKWTTIWVVVCVTIAAVFAVYNFYVTTTILDVIKRW